jgi:hypothetical protein
MFVSYSNITGLYTGCASSAEFIQTAETTVFENQPNPENYYLDEALTLQPLTAQKPSKFHVFNRATNTWEISQIFLPQVKRDKITQINKVREKLLNEPISYQGSLFDCDELSQRNIQAWLITINAGTNPPVGFVWRDYNNQYHAADAEFVRGLNNVIVARGTLIYQTSWTKKAEIDALTTVEQVNNYDVNTGW